MPITNNSVVDLRGHFGVIKAQFQATLDANNLRLEYSTSITLYLQI